MGHYFGWMGVIGGRWDITQGGWGGYSAGGGGGGKKIFWVG